MKFQFKHTGTGGLIWEEFPDGWTSKQARGHMESVEWQFYELVEDQIKPFMDYLRSLDTIKIGEDVDDELIRSNHVDEPDFEPIVLEQ